MNHQQFRKILLGETSFGAPTPQGFAYLPLKLSDRHMVKSAQMLLFNLQTYKYHSVCVVRFEEEGK